MDGEYVGVDATLVKMELSEVSKKNFKENKTALTYFSSDKSSRGQSQSVSSLEVSCYDHIDDTLLMIFTKEVSSTNWIPFDGI